MSSSIPDPSSQRNNSQQVRTQHISKNMQHSSLKKSISLQQQDFTSDVPFAKKQRTMPDPSMFFNGLLV